MRRTKGEQGEKRKEEFASPRPDARSGEVRAEELERMLRASQDRCRDEGLRFKEQRSGPAPVLQLTPGF